MTIGETIRKAIKEVREGLLGLMKPKDFILSDDTPELPKNGITPVKPKRARTAKGRYRGDDKSTKDVNEARVGGKAPKKKKRKK